MRRRWAEVWGSTTCVRCGGLNKNGRLLCNACQKAKGTPAPPSGSQPQNTRSIGKSSRYLTKGDRIQVRDLMDHRLFNDLIEHIEALEEKVERLEQRTGTPCAGCDGYAAEGDFLCPTCRAT